MFVTAGYDLKFHNADDISLHTYAPSQNGNITSVSWSNDNELLIMLTENSLPEVISLKDPKHIKTTHEVKSVMDVSAGAFLHTNKFVTGLGTSTGQVILYDVKSQSIHKLFKKISSAVNLLDFDSGDKHMAVSSTAGNIFVYDLKSSSVREIYTVPKGCCATSMRFHSVKDNLLLFGIEDGVVTHWDIQANVPTYMFQMHTAPVTGLALIDHRDTFVSVSYDHKFCVYDETSGACTFRSYLQHPLTSVDARENTIAIGTLSGSLYVYDIRNLIVPLLNDTPHNTKINKISFENKRPQNEEPKVEAIKALKQEVADVVRASAEELQANVIKQIGSLHDFILKEFQVMCKEVEEKWEFQPFGNKLNEEENKIL